MRRLLVLLLLAGAALVVPPARADTVVAAVMVADYHVGWATPACSYTHASGPTPTLGSMAADAETVQDLAPPGTPTNWVLAHSGTVAGATPATASPVSTTAAATATGTAAGGALRTLSLSGRVDAALGATQTHACGARVYGSMRAIVDFHLDQPARALLHAAGDHDRTTASHSVLAALTDTATGETVAMAGIGTGGLRAWPTSSDADLLLGAGDYEIALQLDAQAEDADGGVAADWIAGEASLTLDPPGAATSAATGPGKRFVALPDALDCGTHTAAVAIRFRARKQRVGRVLVQVDGTTVRTVKRHRRKPILVGVPIPATSRVTISAVVRLKKGHPSKRKGRQLTVERSYAGCS